MVQTTPIKATAGEGQKKKEVTIMMMPIPQNAINGVRNKRVRGATIVSLIPVRVKTRLIATMIEMIIIVPINSLVAYTKELNTPVTEPLTVSVANHPSTKMPVIQIIVVSRRLIRSAIINTMKARYT